MIFGTYGHIGTLTGPSGYDGGSSSSSPPSPPEQCEEGAGEQQKLFSNHQGTSKKFNLVHKGQIMKQRKVNAVPVALTEGKRQTHSSSSNSSKCCPASLRLKLGIDVASFSAELVELPAVHALATVLKRLFVDVSSFGD